MHLVLKNISVRFFISFEESASAFLENLEEKFPG